MLCLGCRRRDAGAPRCGGVVKERAFFTARKAEWLIGFSAGAGIFIAITAILVLIGWVVGVEGVVRILPGMVAMNPVTAVAFILLGVALWQRSSRSSAQPALKRNLPYVLAGIVALAGVIKLLQCSS